jgi:alpha-L-arabinofuranosidase
LWRDHYAPHRIALAGETDALNAVATKSEDGKTLYFKAVNPSPKNVAVDLQLTSGFLAGDAKFKLVAPGSLQARNTLEQPLAVRPLSGRATTDQGRIAFELPPLSAGVVTIELR